MKEFIDKLISRLEELKNDKNKDLNSIKNLDMKEKTFICGQYDAYGKSIEIVNQLAEEYKGGWIPCDKELPTTEGTYWATLHDVQSGYEYVRRVHWNSFFKRWLWDNGKPLSNLIEVVAWQNIYRPEPYTEGVRK